MHSDRPNQGETQGNSENGADQGPADPDGTGPAAIRRLEEQWQELLDLLSFYLAIQADLLRVSFRRTILWLVAGLLGLAVATSLVVTATVVAVVGLADLVGHALGDRPWAGYLSVGCGALLTIATTLLLTARWFSRAFRNQTVKRYVERRHRQRQQFGRDVAGLAAGTRHRD